MDSNKFEGTLFNQLIYLEQIKSPIEIKQDELENNERRKVINKYCKFSNIMIELGNTSSIKKSIELKLEALKILKLTFKADSEAFIWNVGE